MIFSLLFADSMDMILLFPTCQVRVVRFYVSCLLLLLLLRLLLPRPPLLLLLLLVLLVILVVLVVLVAFFLIPWSVLCRMILLF